MKAMYLSSNVEGEESGNLTVFPGSPMRAFPEDPDRAPHPHAPGAGQPQSKAGEGYLFPHSVRHGPAPCRSGRARNILLYHFCQKCVRGYDFERTARVMAQCTPRQRRLLGDLGYEFRPGSYFHGPLDHTDVILAGG